MKTLQKLLIGVIAFLAVNKEYVSSYSRTVSSCECLLRKRGTGRLRIDTRLYQILKRQFTAYLCLHEKRTEEIFEETHAQRQAIDFFSVK